MALLLGDTGAQALGDLPTFKPMFIPDDSGIELGDLPFSPRAVPVSDTATDIAVGKGCCRQPSGSIAPVGGGTAGDGTAAQVLSTSLHAEDVMCEKNGTWKWIAAFVAGVIVRSMWR